MITTNIDGSTTNANPLFDLLAVVSKPDVYAAKLSELQASIDESNKLIALVGPASEVLKLRDDATAALSEAKKKLADAKASAEKIVQAAQDEATGLLEAARAQVQQTIADADALKADAGSALSVAQQRESSALAAETKAKELAQETKAATAALNNAIIAANTAKSEAEEAKAEIIAKHKAFIESL